MNELLIFNNPDFGEVRTLEENGTVLFCGTDVAKALGYANPRDTVRRHCKGVVKRDGGVRTGTKANGEPAYQIVEMSFIPESDLYRLIFSSKLPTAEKFTDWVTSDILPSIRRHGAYMTPETIEKALTDPDTIIQLATTLKEEREKRMALESKVQEDAPKVLFHDAVAAADDTILIRDLAKLLKQNGVENMGGNRLYIWLRENGYLCKDSSSYNLPTQRSMELGLFKIRESSRIHNGEIVTDKVTRVTGKGQTYFVKKFLSTL